MKILKIMLCAASLIIMSGCSSMFGDNDRIVNVSSVPKGATVTVNSMEVADPTPTKVVVTNMWSPTIISVEKPGCKPKQMVVKPEFQKIGLLNLFIFPGFIVDAITGDMMKVPESQRNFNAKLC